MSKELTEKWKNKELKDVDYYVKNKAGDIVCDYYIEILGHFDSVLTENVKEVLAPVPSYDKVKEMSQKIERLEFDNEALEMAHNEGKEINAELVSKTDELVQKIHILNEQNTKQYNELCEEIKKNNILEKKLEIATKALERYSKDDYYSEGGGRSVNPYPHIARKALKEMEGVK